MPLFAQLDATPCALRLWRAGRPTALGGGVLAVLLAMTACGGPARPGPLFALGVGALAAMFVAFGAVVGWLDFSLLPARAGSTGGPARRRAAGVAMLVVAAGLLFCIGAFWDEIWHRLYGVGTVVSDFRWRPHLLMCGSMALMALLPWAACSRRCAPAGRAAREVPGRAGGGPARADRRVPGACSPV